MYKTARHALWNLIVTSLLKSTDVRSLFPLYHITPFCNLRCRYCEGFPELGLGREEAWIGGPPGDQDSYQLDTRGAKQLLRLLRREFDCLFLTGGEPLLRADLEEIVEYAREIGFLRISINTNGSLLHQHEAILNSVSHLVLSLDSLDPQEYGHTIGMGRATAERILANLERAHALEEECGFRLIVHAVILPGRIHAARRILDYCTDRGIYICLSPMHENYAVSIPPAARDEYDALLQTIIRRKRAGASISGSLAFYENARTLEPYVCLPMLIPRILPRGELLYPCRPRGQIVGSILELGSWAAAVRAARKRFGPPKRCLASCRIRCYIEPSLLMSRPTRLLREAR